MSKKKGKRQIKVIVLYGLPGSGKTYFSKSYNHIPVIDLDAITTKIGGNKFAVFSKLNKEFDKKITYRSFHSVTDAVVIDGLITTNQQLRDIIDSLTVEFAQYQLVFELVYWNEDRETCLYNDKNRRKVSSEISIKNLPFEKPDLQLFPELSQKRVRAMKVVKKSPAIAWITDLLKKLDKGDWEIEQVVETLKFTSSEWYLEGTWGHWDGSSGTISPETPLEFDEFDLLLEIACPNISYLNYKKLKSNCCELVESDTSDYYGGSSSKMCHACDVQKLYDALVEMKMI
jgi:predicted kinase